LGDLGVDRRIILRWVEIQAVRVWNVFDWLRTRTGGGL
jgi:hypothetical protein